MPWGPRTDESSHTGAFLDAEASGSICGRFLPANLASWLMCEPRVLKVGRDQAVERDLHQQIEVELGKDPQCVTRALWSDLPALSRAISG